MLKMNFEKIICGRCEQELIWRGFGREIHLCPKCAKEISYFQQIQILKKALWKSEEDRYELRKKMENIREKLCQIHSKKH